MKGCRHIFPFILLLAVLSVSCSTTRVLAEGECRLASNDIKITGDSKFNTNKIEPYIKQKPGSSIIFGWNPFLNVYNARAPCAPRRAAPRRRNNRFVELYVKPPGVSSCLPVQEVNYQLSHAAFCDFYERCVPAAHFRSLLFAL